MSNNPGVYDAENTVWPALAVNVVNALKALFATPLAGW
jgi:hypothetical protein